MDSQNFCRRTTLWNLTILMYRHFVYLNEEAETIKIGWQLGWHKIMLAAVLRIIKCVWLEFCLDFNIFILFYTSIFVKSTCQ